MDYSVLGQSPVVAVSVVAVAAAYGVMLLWFRRGMATSLAVAPAALSGPGPAIQAERLPVVSVVVAARNEESRIGTCLALLTAQDYPAQHYEIIVVDDGSTDGTAAVVEALASNGPVATRLVRAEGGAGKKAAMARGVDQSSGEIVLTTDADCQVPPTWISAMVSHFAAADVGMVIGFSQIGAPGESYTWLAGWEAEDFLLLMAAAMGSAGAGHPMAASGQNLGYRRVAWAQVGGYTSVMQRVSGDDALLLQLIRRTGCWRVRFASDGGGAAVHPPCSGLGALLRQRARWASNGPYLLHLDPILFLHLCLTLSVNALLVATPVLWASGLVPAPVLAAAWTAKVGAELALHGRAARVFRRADLHRFFPLWALFQPCYVILAGVLGMAGRISWKGRQYRRGEMPSRPPGQA